MLNLTGAEMEKKDLGTRLTGICNGTNSKGEYLARWSRESDREDKLGYVKEKETITVPMKVTVYTLTNGDRYHFVHA